MCIRDSITPGELRIRHPDAGNVDLQRCARGIAGGLRPFGRLLLLAATGQQVGDVQGAVLPFHQRCLEPIDFDPLHFHLLRQQRHQGHRHARRVERQKLRLAARFGQCQTSDLDADIGPYR